MRDVIEKIVFKDYKEDAALIAGETTEEGVRSSLTRV